LIKWTTKAIFYVTFQGYVNLVIKKYPSRSCPSLN